MAMNKKNNFTQSAEVEEFRENILKTAEDLVVNKFPKRIVQLNKLLASDKLTSSPSTVFEPINIPIPDVSSKDPSAVVDTHSKDKEPEEKSSASQSSKSNKAKADAKTDKNDTDAEKAVKKLRYETCPAHMDVVGTKVMVLPNGVVSSNRFIVELISKIKPLISELVEDTNLLKIWLMYLIPRIEDGNNFGVSIQEDVLGEIRASEGEAAAYYDQISRYYALRGKIVAKIAQYPHIDDYRRAIKELDEKEFFSLRLIVAELRNHYATLHDLISKNGDKIRKPRSSNAENMF